MKGGFCMKPDKKKMQDRLAGGLPKKNTVAFGKKELPLKRFKR